MLNIVSTIVMQKCGCKHAGEHEGVLASNLEHVQMSQQIIL